jgi:hypothetical protein
MVSTVEIEKTLRSLHADKRTKHPPIKYFRGLKTKKDVIQRYKRITNPRRTYKPFKTDRGIKTRPSAYTTRFYKIYPGARSLRQKAKATGVPLSIIQKVYNRGLAAWKTGHRPGATGQQWGYARVHSFLTGGKTARTADKDLFSLIKK